MKKSIVLLCILGGMLFAKSQAQGIKFHEGSYQDALAEATKRNVPMFIDFYADWCAPCKMMDKNVFVDQELGDYFNKNFVSVKVDVENEINAKLVKDQEVTSMPTLLFADIEEKSLSKVSGSMDIKQLLEMGKTVKGDMKSFEELYDDYKKNEDDLLAMGEVLNKAPGFVTVQTGMNKQKWISKINKIFEEYIDKKIVLEKALINKDDYNVIKTFHKTEGADDRVIEYMVDHIEEYITDVGEPVAFYIIRYNTELAEELAKKGDKSYKVQVDRIKGDMEPAYRLVQNSTISSQYEMASTNCDALFALFEEKDVDKYITLKNSYFNIQGDQGSAMGLARAAQIMYEAAGNNVSKAQNEEAKNWILLSLKSNTMPIMERVNITALLGDIYKKMDDYDSAKKAYNQAYLESAQIDRLRAQKYVQLLLKRKLELLKLE